MAYSDPTGPADGFEGFVFGAENPDLKPKTPLGFEGLIYSPLIEGWKRPAVAFEGLLVAFKETVRFIKVTDFRGTPIEGCSVTVQNTAGDYTQTTDSLGIAAVEIDVAGTKTIRLRKDKTNKSITYTYASESLTKTIVLQPRLL